MVDYRAWWTAEHGGRQGVVDRRAWWTTRRGGPQSMVDGTACGIVGRGGTSAIEERVVVSVERVRTASKVCRIIGTYPMSIRGRGEYIGPIDILPICS